MESDGFRINRGAFSPNQFSAICAAFSPVWRTRKRSIQPRNSMLIELESLCDLTWPVCRRVKSNQMYFLKLNNQSSETLLSHRFTSANDGIQNSTNCRRDTRKLVYEAAELVELQRSLTWFRPLSGSLQSLSFSVAKSADYPSHSSAVRRETKQLCTIPPQEVLCIVVQP